jgi:glucokinase
VVQSALDHGWSPHGRPADGRSLLAAATDGDSLAIEAFARAGGALGVAIASATHLLELDVVAVGGGLTQAGEFLLGPARDAFARHARMQFAQKCRIVRATLDVDAGLIGAAGLVSCGDRYWIAGAD